MLTPDDVRNVVFGRAWRKERGYDEAEVDRFLGRVEATLRGKQLVTARDALTAKFNPRRRGGRAYKKAQVDEFLDKVALTLMKLEVRADERRKSRPAEEPGPVRKPVENREEPAGEPLPKRPAPEPAPDVGAAAAATSSEQFRGLQPATSQNSALDKAEVDAFMDRVQATLRGIDHLTPNDVLNAQFNPPAPGMPGYDEAGVLAFLELVSSSIRNINRHTGTNMRPVTTTSANMHPVTATGTHMRPVVPTGTNLPPIAAQTGAFPMHVGDDRPARQRMIPGRRRPPRR